MSFDPFRKYTQARIGLGNKAPALPSKAWLEFAFHHACAQDAVHAPWDLPLAARAIESLGLGYEIVHTRVKNREEYLVRPDLGRALSEASADHLTTMAGRFGDVVILASNGLSSHAVSTHLPPFLGILKTHLEAAGFTQDHHVVLAENGRVALIDHVGDLLKPALGIVIIGERPGLSAADSLAVYLTYRPKRGLTDAARNCISNIRPPLGLSYEMAALKTVYLAKEALRRQLSGVMLKEETPRLNYP